MYKGGGGFALNGLTNADLHREFYNPSWIMCSNVARFSIRSSIYLAASLMAQEIVSLQWLINYVSSSNHKTTIIHDQGNYQACKRFSPCTTKKLFLMTTKVLLSMDKASSLVAQELLPLQ